MHSQDESSSPSANTLHIADTPLRMTMALAEVNSRLYTRQMEVMRQAVHDAVEEETQQMISWISNAGNANELLAQWPDMVRSRIDRFGKLTTDCLEITSQTMSALNPWRDEVEESADAEATAKAPSPTEAAVGKHPTIERRRNRIDISFPERRLAMATPPMPDFEISNASDTYSRAY